MEKFKKILQHYINVEITIVYGCIGTRYSHILIVQDGKIKCIGTFLYSLWRNESNNQEVLQWVELLGKKSEQFRTGVIDKEPSLAYSGSDLIIYYQRN